MPTETLSAGRTYAILQNVAMALPPGLNFVQSLVAIQSSIDGSTWAALTAAETTGVNTAAQFVRCATGNTSVSVKRV